MTPEPKPADDLEQPTVAWVLRNPKVLRRNAGLNRAERRRLAHLARKGGAGNG